MVARATEDESLHCLTWSLACEKPSLRLLTRTTVFRYQYCTVQPMYQYRTVLQYQYSSSVSKEQTQRDITESHYDIISLRHLVVEFEVGVVRPSAKSRSEKRKDYRQSTIAHRVPVQQQNGHR